MGSYHIVTSTAPIGIQVPIDPKCHSSLPCDLDAEITTFLSIDTLAQKLNISGNIHTSNHCYRVPVMGLDQWSGSFFPNNISHSPAATIPTQPTFLPHLHAKTTAASTKSWKRLFIAWWSPRDHSPFHELLRHAIDFFARKKNCLLDEKRLLNDFYEKKMDT